MWIEYETGRLSISELHPIQNNNNKKTFNWTDLRTLFHEVFEQLRERERQHKIVDLLETTRNVSHCTTTSIMSVELHRRLS
jgi:predicted transcriptional regulator